MQYMLLIQYGDTPVPPSSLPHAPTRTCQRAAGLLNQCDLSCSTSMRNKSASFRNGSAQLSGASLGIFA
jgi:hypothetical protein